LDGGVSVVLVEVFDVVVSEVVCDSDTVVGGSEVADVVDVSLTEAGVEVEVVSDVGFSSVVCDVVVGLVPFEGFVVGFPPFKGESVGHTWTSMHPLLGISGTA
jgi:hypothetical protein